MVLIPTDLDHTDLNYLTIQYIRNVPIDFNPHIINSMHIMLVELNIIFEEIWGFVVYRVGHDPVMYIIGPWY